MLTYELTFRIFQHGRFAEELTAKTQFDDADDLANELIRFAAREARMRHDRPVYELGMQDSAIQLPASRQGYGPNTRVVITKATRVADSLAA